MDGLFIFCSISFFLQLITNIVLIVSFHSQRSLSRRKRKHKINFKDVIAAASELHQQEVHDESSEC